MRARLLQFVTGTSKVPMNGFAELQGIYTILLVKAHVGLYLFLVHNYNLCVIVYYNYCTDNNY